LGEEATVFDKLLLIIRIASLVVGACLIAFIGRPFVAQGRLRAYFPFDLVQPFSQVSGLAKGIKTAFVVLCVLNIAFVLVAVLLHLNFPLHLNLMEGVVLQHFERAVSGLPIYPEPSPGFVPLAYNVGYYLLATPFGWLFGPSLFTLRLVATLGSIGSGLLVYRAVQVKTNSRGWGFIALGLFAAAYGVMEAYLDTAHSDSWLLCTALLGTYLIDQKKSKAWHLVGLLVLVASFWFKQHGVLFALGGLLFLFWRDGIRAGLFYALVVVLLGPVLYIYAGPRLFGPDYHFFTWVVPRSWSELNIATFTRYARFIISNYAFLALAALAFVVCVGLRERAFMQRRDLSVWHVQWLFAMLSGFMGSLDPGSANNVFISMGVWCIIVGVWSAQFWLSQVHPNAAPTVQRLQVVGLFASFCLLLYNPLQVIPPVNAGSAYQDFIQTLHQFDGPVYAPFTSYIPGESKLYPNAHWVALEDMVRRPGDDGRDAPETRRQLKDAIQPNGNAYLLTNLPIEQMVPAMAFLGDYYVLDQDFGKRFAALEGLPGRFGHGYPQYLYRHKQNQSNQSNH
jgi:hypothetical protein